MYFRCLSVLLLLACSAASRPLRVCADPNDLPFSNDSRQGFENRLAQLVAKDLGTTLEYIWISQRKSAIDKSLNANECDVWFGVPSELPDVLTTKPYYRSAYVFISRKDHGPVISSLYDEHLRDYRIGIHLVGDDYAPPAVILAREGLSQNVVGFSLFGGAGESNPAARLVEAVAIGEVDLGIVWGPIAGYFSKSEELPLRISNVKPQNFGGVPFVYDISAGVRKQDATLKDEIDSVLARNCRAINSLLNEFGVPRVTEGQLPCDGSQSPSASLR